MVWKYFIGQCLFYIVHRHSFDIIHSARADRVQKVVLPLLVPS